MVDRHTIRNAALQDGFPPTRITVLISGNGTNLQALMNACGTGLLPSAKIIRIISNRKDAYGLVRATTADPPIPTFYHNLVKYKTNYPKTDQGVQLAREAYDTELARVVLADEPDLVVCAGWMHILANEFLDPLKRAMVPVINLHPALPKFKGANAIQRAYVAFQQGEIEETGVMVHYVISEVDSGEPILVRKVPMFADETEVNLTQRIHHVEWEVIVEGTRIAIQRLPNEKTPEI
ncbi:MAG: hypothetical protein M1830_001647 [Pleopsidium flavum]|nr:MAG: hypothetical protein M1830_001647 [Pleopsidium flavum]